MDISNVLKRAWEITWKNKGLWILGILANCSGNGGQGSGNVGRSSDYRFSRGEFPQLENWLQNVSEETWITIAIVAAIVILLLAIIFWMISAIGNGGLISGFQMAEMGETPTLAIAFRKGIHYIWKLLAIQFIIGIAVLLIVIVGVIGGGLVSVLTLGIGLICLLPLICVFIPLALILSIYTLLAQVALIVEELGITASFKRAWEVMRSNPGEIIIMGLILGISGFVVGLILSIPMILMALPLIIALIKGNEIVGLSSTVIGILLYLPVFFLTNGIVRTFITGSWTLTYRGLIAPKSTQISNDVMA